MKNEGDLKKGGNFGIWGDLTKGNALKKSRQNSEEVLGVEIFSDTTLTLAGWNTFNFDNVYSQCSQLLSEI